MTSRVSSCPLRPYLALILPRTCPADRVLTGETNALERTGLSHTRPCILPRVRLSHPAPAFLLSITGAAIRRDQRHPSSYLPPRPRPPRPPSPPPPSRLSRPFTFYHVFSPSRHTVRFLPVCQHCHRCIRGLCVNLTLSAGTLNLYLALHPDRRAQTQHSEFVSGSVSSSSGLSGPPDTEAAIQDEEDEYAEDEDGRPIRPRTRGDDALLDHIQWDEDLTPAPSSENRRFDFSSQLATDTRWPGSSVLEDEDDLPTPRPDPGERTPLLERPSSSQLSIGLPPPTSAAAQIPHYAALDRRISTTSVRSKASFKAKNYHVGHSTFAQTVRVVTFWIVPGWRLTFYAAAAECSRGSLWHRYALRTPRVRLCGLDWRNRPHHWLWLDLVLYVRYKAFLNCPSQVDDVSAARRSSRG